MDETKATSYTPIDLYSMKSERTSLDRGYKAWTIFQHPFTRQWVSAYGPFYPSREPDENGHIGKLTMKRLRSGSPDWVVARTTEKINKGYQKHRSVGGNYINIDTGEIIDADEMGMSDRKILRRNAATPESIEAYRNEVKGYNAALEEERIAKEVEQERVAREKVARLTEASVQNWF